MTEADIVNVRLFDKLEITMGGVSLGEAEMRSQQLVRLFSLLIRNRQTGSSAQQLAEGLWGGEVRDPANALKNLIYRLRKLIEKTWGRRDFILTGKGLYQINPKIRMEVDMERFEALLEEAERTADDSRRRTLLQQALDLYRGRYLADHEDDPSIIFLQNYYRDRYLEAVQTLTSLYEAERMHPETSQVCERALLIEPKEGLLHCILLRAYIGDLRLSKAEQQYHETMRVMGDHLSSERLQELRDLYEEMMKQQHSSEADLDTIISELVEDDPIEEAFYCDYGIFRWIYELQLRERERKGYPITLVLISLTAENSRENEEGSACADPAEPEPDAAVLLENEGMERMHSVLMRRLRHGDVITKYSNTQFLVMLPDCSEECAKTVLDRLTRGYEDMAPRHAAAVNGSCREVR